MRHPYRIITMLLLAFAAISCGGRHGGKDDGAPVQNDTIYPLGFLTDTLSMEEGVVASGDVFSSLMIRLGLPASKVNPLISAGEGLFDVRKMRAGVPYQAYYAGDSLSRELHYFVYGKNRIESTVFRCFDSLAVWSASKPVEHLSRYADVSITTSLSYDVAQAGGSQQLTNALADVFAWTIDFFGLQSGDRVRVFYDETRCEGSVISVDTIRYALFEHAGKEYQAVMFNQKDGKNVYWNEKGESMQKAFLKAPLHFTRISSGFSYNRRHPITRKVQPHTGVDYAAPTGTPVVSIGDGTVVSAGYAGAGGNTVKISHNGTYMSAYLHLSKFGAGIRSGAKVRQGQVIGYVGSTGRSTGPHLDFRIWKNGQPLNPLRMESPSLEPARKENLAAIDSLCCSYRGQL